MNRYEEFKHECSEEIAVQSADRELVQASRHWLNLANAKKYSYHFEWLGRPIIQYPQDILALQEILWSVQPDAIIETGIAHGGSLIFSASMLELNAVCGGPQDAFVLGVDIDIRAHNRQAIEAHPLAKRIQMLQGSSIAPELIEQVQARIAGRAKVLVMLDSNHTYDHVKAELEVYAPLTGVGSYCIVFDTVIEDMPAAMFPNRPWGPGNNPKIAVWDYLKDHPEFAIDRSIEQKLLITVAPDGFLRRVR
jgi:cephalosporin hydroxylase